MKISIIVAMTHNHVIGNNNELPWHIKEDLINFRNKTINKTVIMGQKTYESIVAKLNKPLPNRHNIVISRTLSQTPGIEVCSSLETAIELAKEKGKEIFIIGGRQIYELAIPPADQLIISWIKKEYTGDTKFPAHLVPIDYDQWRIIGAKRFKEFDLNIYQRQ